MEQNHEFQLSPEELTYLKQVVLSDKSLTDMLKFQEGGQGRKANVMLTRVEAEQLRAHLTQRLAGVGFEKDYSLGKDGQILEELIDRFYLP